MSVGKPVRRVDAYGKVTGRAQYTDDCFATAALTARILHSTIANGLVTDMDISRALSVEGVVKIITCFDVPDRPFPTAGHPWSTDPGHRDVADRLLLNRRVRLYGDDIAVVIAEDDIACARALKLIQVTYEEYPPLLDPQEAMKPGAGALHEAYPDNVLGHTKFRLGDYDAAIAEPGLVRVEGWYETPIVQHCHIENPISYAYMDQGRVVVVASTQIPHIVRRIVGQALGLPWGKVRLVKPYIGGGFGNKQDALYEPLAGYLTMQVGGRLVKLDTSREETFVSTRVRHAIRYHMITHTRPDGTMVARKMEAWSNQGAYASHGHSIAAKGVTAFRMLYCNHKPALEADAYTVFTNLPTAGAMRAYGIPQVSFAMECHLDDIAARLGMNPVALRQKNFMPVGLRDEAAKLENYFDSLNQCVAAGRKHIDYDNKLALYQNQTGPVRRGVGMAVFWYNTAVHPISLEASTCRMIFNQDASLQVQLPETEIGQGADTIFAQMSAQMLGVPVENVHVVSTQDTDLTPFGTGAYGSRQTYVAGAVIHKTGMALRRKVFEYTHYLTGKDPEDMDIVDAVLVRKSDGAPILPLEDVVVESFYSLDRACPLLAEETAHVKTNALSLGCCFAEVEVDIPLCKVKVLNLINVHDCGRLINPQLAAAQVHGGMSMSLGYGLSEVLLFDPKTGKPLNNNLLDYKLLTALDHPDRLHARFIENFEPTSPFGTKALGEPPAIPVAPAIRNAVFQATGVSISETPLTPHVLFRHFTQAGLIPKKEAAHV